MEDEEFDETRDRDEQVMGGASDFSDADSSHDEVMEEEEMEEEEGEESEVMTAEEVEDAEENVEATNVSLFVIHVHVCA